MRRALAPLAAASSILAACGPAPTAEEEALNRQGSHPEQLAQPGPGEPQQREGPVTPAERNQLAQNEAQPAAPERNVSALALAAAGVVQQFGDLLEQRRFADARRLYAGDGAASGLTEEEFERRFDGFRTINSAVQEPERVTGTTAEAQVQLTIDGELDSGEPYARTGLVWLKREGGGWRIVNVRLAPQAPPQLERQVTAQEP